MYDGWQKQFAVMELQREDEEGGIIYNYIAAATTTKVSNRTRKRNERPGQRKEEPLTHFLIRRFCCGKYTDCCRADGATTMMLMTMSREECE